MTRIFVVTHGDKFGGINPHMTEKGFEQISKLRPLLPPANEIWDVVRGTGRRHLDVSLALNLAVTRITAVAGDGDSLDVVDGKKIIILSDGTNFEMDSVGFTTISDIEPAAKALVVSLHNNSVVCAGRPFMMMLGKKDAGSAMVYEISVENNEIVGIVELMLGD